MTPIQAGAMLTCVSSHKRHDGAFLPWPAVVNQLPSQSQSWRYGLQVVSYDHTWPVDEGILVRPKKLQYNT